MKKTAAVVLSVILSVCTAGCNDGADTICFHDVVFSKAELSAETVEWLERYNGFTEEEQLSVSYIPDEIHRALYADADREMEESAEAGS